MKKISGLLLVLALATACNGSGSGDSDSGESSTPAVTVGGEPTTPTAPSEPTTPSEPTPPTPPTPPAPPSTGVPTAALTFDSNIELIQMTAAQEAKFDKAIEIVKSVVGTAEFRSKVLNHTYSGSKTFVNNNGLTNAQIYAKVLEAAEKLFPVKNNAMDMEVEMYTASTNVVGYTYSSSKRIWVNTKYFNQYTAAGVAGNLMHEWLHKVGFGHDSSATARRPYSVPYAIGKMVRDIGPDFL